MKYGKKDMAISFLTGLFAYILTIIVLGITVQVGINLFDYFSFLPMVFRLIFTAVIDYIFLLIFSMVLLYISLRIVYRLFPTKEGIYDINSKTFNNWQIQSAWNVYTAFCYKIVPAADFAGMYILKWSGLKSKGGGLFSTGGILEPSMTELGRDCIIGHQAIVSGHIVEGEKLIFKKIKIGDNVTIGGKAMIMPGVSIGNNSIVAAGAIVPKYTVIPADVRCILLLD